MVWPGDEISCARVINVSRRIAHASLRAPQTHVLLSVDMLQALSRASQRVYTVSSHYQLPVPPVRTLHAMAATSSSPSLVGLPPLRIHLDLNGTIVCTDKVGGKQIAEAVNSMLARIALGEVTADGKWAPIPGSQGLIRSDGPGRFKGLPTYADEPQPISYGLYVESMLHPKEPVPEGPAEEVKRVQAHNKQSRTLRKQALHAFTQEGQPGAYLADMADSFESMLHVEPADPSAGHHFVLPAYFTLLEALVEAGMKFELILRTFGADAAEVLQEHNAYCAGKHPLYPGAQPLDGSVAGRPDLRVSLPRCTATATLGAYDVPHICAPVAQPDAGDALVMQRFDGPHGLQNWLNTLHANAASGSQGLVCAVMDDFPSWHLGGEVGAKGKLFPLNPGSAAPLEVFFDDNILQHWDDCKIVHPIDADTGKPIPADDEVLRSVHLVRVLTSEVVQDPHYFVRMLQAAHTAQLKWA